MKLVLSTLAIITLLFLSPKAQAIPHHNGEAYLIIYFDHEPSPEAMETLKKKGCEVVKTDRENNVVYVNGDNCDSCFLLNPDGAKKIVYIQGDKKIERNGLDVQQKYNNPNLLELFFNFVQ